MKIFTWMVEFLLKTVTWRVKFLLQINTWRVKLLLKMIAWRVSLSIGSFVLKRICFWSFRTQWGFYSWRNAGIISFLLNCLSFILFGEFRPSNGASGTCPNSLFVTFCKLLIQIYLVQIIFIWLCMVLPGDAGKTS